MFYHQITLYGPFYSAKFSIKACTMSNPTILTYCMAKYRSSPICKNSETT